MSTWYKGILTSQLATDQDTGGAFDIVMSYMRSGTEPPPHVREREHEFFYVLEGELEAFIANKCFRVSKGECFFFPSREPHAFKILSPEIRMLLLITPGGFLRAINGMATPAQTLDIPRDEVFTYANMNLQETMQVFERYGVRISFNG
jgi:mannose-6-phosphate isomerase-like protein (cupin superfamily)